MVRADIRRALVGGSVAALIATIAIIGVGRITSFEARVLIEAVLPGMHFLASAAIAAGATVLALMLTLLGISYTTEFRFRADHYRRVRNVSVLTTLTILAATLMLVFTTVPIQEAEALELYYRVVYYGLTAGSAVIGGLVVAVVLMLNDTVRSLAAVGLGQTSHLILEEEADAETEAVRSLR